MKINFGAKILDIKGEQIKEGPVEVTLGLLATSALLGLDQNERDLKASDKKARFALALITSKDEVSEISVEDAALISKLIGAKYPPLYVGRAAELLDKTE